MINFPMLADLLAQVTNIYIPNTTGTNTYAASIDNYDEHKAGQAIFVKFTNGNTGLSTLNINGLGAKTIVRNGSTTLLSGDITPNSVHQLVYDGTYFQLQTQGAKLTALQLASPLAGFSASPNSAVATSDTILNAFGKLQAQINALKNASGFVTGTYTGNGASSRTINLGFQPSAVLVMNSRGETVVYTGTSPLTITMYGGLAVNGSPVYNQLNALSVATTGFVVYYGGYGSTSAQTNWGGMIYNYIAFK